MNDAQQNGFPPFPPLHENKQNKSTHSGCFIASVAGALLLFFASALVFCGVMTLIVSGFSELGNSVHGGKSFGEEIVSGSPDAKNKIAVIDVRGVISADGNSSSMYQGADANAVCEQIRTAAADRDVKAVIVYIDSPGGEVVASDIINNEIKKLRHNHKVPVVACMGSIAASGGYYVAVACDYIIANRLTLTGSIGVIIESYKYYDLFTKIGLQSEVYKSGPMKDMLDGSRPTGIAEREIVQSLVDGTYNEFVKVVAEGRPKLSVNDIKGTCIGDGRVFNADVALKYGLVDELGFFEDAVEKAAKLAGISPADCQVLRYKKSFSLMQLLAEVKTGAGTVNLKVPGPEKISGLQSGKLYFLPPSM